MKAIVKVITVVVMAVMVLSIPPTWAAKKYEGQTMQVLLGITPQAREIVMEFIAPKLKEKWGINLATETMGSTSQIEKIVVMKDNPRITIAGWDIPIGVKAAEMGLAATIDIERAPNLKQLYEWAYTKVNGQLKVLSTSLQGVGIIYNEDIFKKKGLKPPTSWYDLWRKDLSDRISITAPESTWGLSALVTLARLEGGGENNIDPGFKKLKTLLPHIHTIHTWSSELSKLMQLGEVWMGTTGDNMGPAMRAKGFPARWVAPKEGSPMVNGGMSIIKNAPYQDVAYDFLNLYNSVEFQILKTHRSGSLCPNKNVWGKLTEKVKSDFALTPEASEQLLKLDWSEMNKKRAGWTERWHKEMK